MSTSDCIQIDGNGFSIYTETTSGCMNDAQKEIEMLQAWKKRAEPQMKAIFKVVEKEVKVLLKATGPPLLIKGPTASPGTELETVWEESIDGLDVPSHMDKGNGPCIYRMRLWPKTFSHRLDVLFHVKALPSKDVRDGWKARLLTAVENNYKVDGLPLL